MIRDESYRVQDGCWNCGRCFAKRQYDDPTRYYCIRGAPDRPPCLSVCMDEYVEHVAGEPFEQWERRFMAADAAWSQWREGREVEREGICDHHPKAQGPQPSGEEE